MVLTVLTDLYSSCTFQLLCNGLLQNLSLCCNGAYEDSIFVSKTGKSAWIGSAEVSWEIPEMSSSAVTQRLRITPDFVNSSYFIKLCLSDTFKQLDLLMVVFTCKYSVFTVYTHKKAVPRNSSKEPPNNSCKESLFIKTHRAREKIWPSRTLHPSLLWFWL